MSLARTNARKRASETFAVSVRSGLTRWWKHLAIATAIVVVLLCARAWRSHQERRIVALSTARASHLLRADTAPGYREAAEVLGLRAAELDPVGAGSLRALALALLALDYRDEEAARQARALVDASRARAGDAEARGRMALAAAALALREARLGTALEQLSASPDAPLRHVLTARAAIAAGNPGAAGESVQRALSVDARFPAALALRGDLLRRSGRSTAARDAYAAALGESRRALEAGAPGEPDRAPHARAAFGLAKLALSRDVATPEATAPLLALVDGSATVPMVERARAALYLGALQSRLGDAGGAAATLAKPELDSTIRAWLERTAAQLAAARGPYRVPDATPAALASASDDDPYVAPAPPAARPQPPPSRPKLHGFKVHGPEPKKAPARSKQRSKRATAQRDRARN